MKLHIFLQSIGMTYVEFGKLIGYHPTYLKEVKSGKYRPSLRLCREIEKSTYGKVTIKDLRDDQQNDQLDLQVKMKRLVESL